MEMMHKHENKGSINAVEQIEPVLKSTFKKSVSGREKSLTISRIENEMKKRRDAEETAQEELD